MKRIVGSLLGVGLLAAGPAFAGVKTQTTETTTVTKPVPQGQTTQQGSMGAQPGAVGQQQPGAVAPSGPRELTLTVKNVDRVNHKVDFEAQVKPEANILEDGRPIKLDRLEEGDQVRASFDPVTGEVSQLQVTKNAPKSRQERMKNDASQFGNDVKQGTDDFGNDIDDRFDE